MAKSLKKLEAIKLRQSGLSIKDISSKIEIARSTVSIWCRDVVLSKNDPRMSLMYLRADDISHVVPTDIHLFSKMGLYPKFTTL